MLVKFLHRIALLSTALMVFACAPADEVGGADSAAEEDSGSGTVNWWDELPRAAWSPFQKIEVEQPTDWFQVYRIYDGIYAIHEDGQFEEVISYLIEGSERALLLDTGIGVGDMAGVVAQLTELPVSVINSHSHYDHVGGNHQFERIVAMDLAYSAARSAGRSNAEMRDFIGPGWVWKPLPGGVTVDSYRSEPYQISEFVEDGELIDLGGGVRIEVLAVPGHTPDSLVLLDRARRLLFMGDTFYPATLYAHLGDADFEDYVRSAEKLAELVPVVDFLLPAHNEPLLPSYYLIALRDAFRAIQAPNAPFVLRDGNREYDFDGFSVMVSDPPPWQE